MNKEITAFRFYAKLQLSVFYSRYISEMTFISMYCLFRAADVTDEEYNEFYKSVSKGSDEPMAKIHFTAEGEVTFKSILYVPKSSPFDTFSNYGKKVDHIKVGTM